MKVYSITIYYAITKVICLVFFQDGITEFDERFFDTQKNRQLLELQIIPKLTKYASLDSRPSKRTKFA